MFLAHTGNAHNLAAAYGWAIDGVGRECPGSASTRAAAAPEGGRSGWQRSCGAALIAIWIRCGDLDFSFAHMHHLPVGLAGDGI